jgi:HSP20 family protein
MLIRYDPLREMDRQTQQLRASAPPLMAMDAYHRGSELVAHFDLPGVDPAAIDLRINDGGLTVRATRSWPPAEGDEIVVLERRQGTFTRRLTFGSRPDVDLIRVRYDRGVLTLTIPDS